MDLRNFKTEISSCPARLRIFTIYKKCCHVCRHHFHHTSPCAAYSSLWLGVSAFPLCLTWWGSKSCQWWIAACLQRGVGKLTVNEQKQAVKHFPYGDVTSVGLIQSCLPRTIRTQQGLYWGGCALTFEANKKLMHSLRRVPSIQKTWAEGFHNFSSFDTNHRYTREQFLRLVTTECCNLWEDIQKHDWFRECDYEQLYFKGRTHTTKKT